MCEKTRPLWIGEKLGPLKTSGPQAVNSEPFLTRLQEKSSASISKKERAELIKWRLEFGKGVRQRTNISETTRWYIPFIYVQQL